MTDYLKSHARQLYKNGYPIIPIVKGEKHPGKGKKSLGWQNWQVTPPLAKKWIADKDYTGVGILTATVPSIDIDLYDVDAVNAVIGYLEDRGLVDFDTVKRTGEAPKVLIPYRLVEGEQFNKLLTPAYLDEFGNRNKIEILGTGNQFVAYHIHPDTQKPYHYNGGADLLETRYEDLTELSVDQGVALLDWFENELIPELGWELAPSTRKTKFKGGRQVKSDADDDFDMLNNVVNKLDNISDLKVVMTLEAIDPDCDYDTWSMIGMGLWHQYEGSDLGRELFTQWSKKGSKFKKGDINDHKWNSFEPNYDRGQPVTFAFALAQVDRDETHERIEELRELIIEDDEEEDDVDEHDTEPDFENQGDYILPKIGTKARKKIDRYVDRYLLVADGQLVIDTTKPAWHTSLALADFHTDKCNDFVEVGKPTKTDPANTVHKPVSQLWLSNKDRKRVSAFKYFPGKKRFFKDENTGTKYANIFCFPDHKKIAERNKIDYEGIDRLDVFFDHMNYIFPCEKERKWMMQWIAFTIQKPHLRCPIAPILVARTKGIGRSWLLSAITRMIDPANVKTVDIGQIIGENGNFNDHLVDCKIIACEELRISDGKDRYKVENTLKSDVTDRRLFIRRKYGTQMTEDVFGNFIFFTNYPDAMVIDPGERRYNVFSGPMKKNTPSYYARLFAWLDDFDKGRKEVESNVAQLFHYFENLDISDFDINNPMQTPALETMVSMGKSDTEHLYDDFVNKSQFPVMEIKDVADEIARSQPMSEGFEISSQRVKGVMRQKALSIGRVTIEGVQRRLWAIDNIQYPLGEAKKLYKKYLEQKLDEDFEGY